MPIVLLKSACTISISASDAANVNTAARERVGEHKALQGNLDPAILGAPWNAVEAEVLDVLRRNNGHPGHIFNLGHGVTPDVDPAVLERVVETVHAYRHEA